MHVKNAWYMVGWSGNFVPGNLVERTVLDGSIVLWRTMDGSIVAYDNRCLHKRFPLSQGKLENDVLECAYHGWKYDHEGACVAIPALTEGQRFPKRRQLGAYPVREQDGAVWLWPGDVAVSEQLEPPRTERLASDEYSVYYGEDIHCEADPQLLIENLVDFTHFYPLHESTIGNIENQTIPVTVEEEDEAAGRVVVKRYQADYELPSAYRSWFRMDVGDREHRMIVENPSLVTVQMALAPSGKLGTDEETGFKFYHTICPQGSRAFTWRWAITSRKDHEVTEGVSVAQAIGTATLDIAAEDAWAIREQQRMYDMADNGYTEVGIKADTAVFAVRRLIGKLEGREEVDTHVDDGEEVSV